MPSWFAKAAAQGFMSVLPQPQRWNHLFQAHVTKSLALTDAYFLQKWRHCAEHLEAYRRETGTGADEPFNVVELGTGWYPIIPVGLALNGARAVWSVDQNPLVEHGRVVETLRRYIRLADRVTVTRPQLFERLPELVGRADSYDAFGLLRELGIVVHVGDARSMDLPDGSVDLLVSNNTLEHIPRVVIAGIFGEFRRLAGPDSVMSHFIDLADHYAGFDKKITAYNFLKYRERTWRLFNNSLHYQNRLRIPDYRALHTGAGWKIVDERNTSRPVEQLRSVELAQEFASYSEAELLVCKSLITSRPA
jgi:hypothetical protein